MRPLLLCAGLVLALVVPAGADAASVGLNAPPGSGLGLDYARTIILYNGGSAPDGGTYAALDTFVAGHLADGAKPVIAVSGKGAAPADPAAYAAYVGALARRYGNRVAAWEIWNEQDSALWWGREGGDPAAYADLLRLTYPQVRPHAQVFVGGLTGNDYAFLESLYGALGGSSANAFDGVATHTDTACAIVGPDSFYRDPNGKIGQFSFLGLRTVHDTMAAHGDGGKPLWITELGWNTSSRTCDSGMWAGQKAGGVSEADQARFLGMAYHCLKAYPYVTAAIWFNLADGATDAPIDRYGLRRPDGSAKPALAAFRDVLAGRDAFAGQACGDFEPPTLSFTAPADGGLFLDILPISASATDTGGVGRISLAADDKPIRNFTTGKASAKDFPKTLAAAIDWQGAKGLALGAHTVTATAVDGSGNTATKTLRITKVSPSSLQNLPTSFRPLRLRGQGGDRRLTVAVTAATSRSVGFRATHKVHVVFQKLVRGRWKTAHKYTRTAKQAFTLRVSLEKARWRVQARFPAKAPFRGARTPFLRFTA